MDDLLHILKYGSRDEIGKAITAISRRKDPRYGARLKELMHSDDRVLAVMAAYALAETGNKEGFDFIDGILKTDPAMFVSPAKLPDLDLEEILKFPAEVTSAMDLYNRSYFQQSKDKILKILKIYSDGVPKIDIPRFDEHLEYVAKKTNGLLLNALSVCEFHMGNIEEASRYSSEALTLGQETGDPQLLKIAFGDAAALHMGLGNYYTSLEMLHKSLEIDKDSHDPWRKKNRSLSELSYLYYLIGQHEKALDFGNEALKVAEKENDPKGSASCLNLLGIISAELGERKQALEYYRRALDLSRDELDDKAVQCRVLNNLGFLHYSLSETEEASEHFAKALKLAVMSSSKSIEGTVLSNIAMMEFESGEVDEAAAHAMSALNIAVATHDISARADAHLILGTIEDLHNGNMTEAYSHYREAIKSSEILRKNVMLDDLKISFAANNTFFYRPMISLCLRMGRIDDVFEYIERSKSRALADMLSSALDSIGSKNLSPEQSKEISNLKARLEWLRRQLSAIASGEDKGPSDSRSEILEELKTAERHYIDTFEALKIKDPEWISLASIDVADISTVRNGLDDETIMLEFYQTGEDLLIIVVGKDFQPYPIRVEMEVEREAERVFGLIESLSSGNDLDARSHGYIKEVRQPLSHFFDLLLEPVFHGLGNFKRLVIVPHCFWHYLPFHALYDKHSEEYLVDKLAISYAPSATAFKLCCRGDTPEYGSVLILANPTGDLPYAEEEAERISARFGTNGEVNIYKKDKATFDLLSKQRGCDVIHLACHGYFRGDDPLFSHLLLADQEGGASPVFLPDIFNLRLDASLVSLSACETGLSEFTLGDELIGISRAFFYAGARSVLTSLWTVNDESTSVFMDRFYEGLLSHGLSKAESLRLAMRELKDNPEYRHPYFWAPFYLSGDWR